MRRMIVASLWLVLLSSGVFAEGPKFGVGFFAGVDFPVLQQDQANGTIFGFRVRYEAIPTVVLEPNVCFSNYSSPDFEEFEYDLEGSKVTSFGLDVVLGNSIGATGFKPYFLAGIGLYNRSNETIDDIYDSGGARFGFSGGLGIALGLSPSFDVDARAKLSVAASEGGGSRKSLAVTGGLNYYFGGN